MPTQQFTDGGTFTAPALTTAVQLEAFGSSGASGISALGEGGGKGGDYSITNAAAVTPGEGYAVVVGAGGVRGGANGLPSTVKKAGGVALVGAKGGDTASAQTGATTSNGTNTGDTSYTGGNGANGTVTLGGGGGSSAGTRANGNNASGQTGGTAPTGGFKGGDGGNNTVDGTDGDAPGGAGAGGGAMATGKAGQRGQVDATWTPAVVGPTVPATNIAVTAVGETTFSISCTAGNGKRVIFVKQTSDANDFPVPVDNTTYTANTNVTAGSQIGSTGWRCVLNGTGTTVNCTGATLHQPYRVAIIEYNGAAASEKYMSQYTTTWYSTWTGAAASAVQGQGDLDNDDGTYSIFDGLNGGLPRAEAITANGRFHRAVNLLNRSYPYSGPIPPVGNAITSTTIRLTDSDGPGNRACRATLYAGDVFDGLTNGYNANAESLWLEVSVIIGNYKTGMLPNSGQQTYSGGSVSALAAALNTAASFGGYLALVVSLTDEETDDTINFDTSAAAILTAVWTPTGFQTNDADAITLVTEAQGPEGSGCAFPVGTASKDTYIDSSAPSTNFGAQSTMLVGPNPLAAGSETKILLEFDLTGLGIPLNSTIDTVDLLLFRTSTGSILPSSLNFKRISTSWLELIASYSTQPSTSTPSVTVNRTFAGAGTGSGQDTFSGASMVATVNDAIDNRNRIWSYMIDAGGLSTDFIQYASGEIGGGSSPVRPQLCIGYTSPTGLATVVTTPAVGITAHDATVGGNVTDDGGAAVTSKGIVYWDNTNQYGSTQVISGGPEPFGIPDGSGEGSWTGNFSGGLPPGHTIFYRAYATNANGDSYGATEQFTTLELLNFGTLLTLGV